MAGAFYGVVVKPGRETPYVPHPERWILHVSQACILANVKEGKRVSLMLKHSSDDDEEGEGAKDSPHFALCTLVAGRQDSVSLDLFLDRYAEFSVLGDAEVHLTGYYAPPDTLPATGEQESDEEDEDFMGEGEDDSEDDEEEEDDEARAHAIMGLGGMPLDGMLGGPDSDDSSDEGGEGDSDDSDGMDSDEDERKPSHCVIEELDEAEVAVAAKPASKAEQQAGSKRAAEEPVKQEKASKKQAVEAAQQQQQQKEQLQQQLKEQKAAQLKEQKAAQLKEQKAAQPKQKKEEQKAPNGSAAVEVKTNKKSVRRWENGFEIEDLKFGQPNGKLAKAGKKVQVHYVGKLKSNGKVFDSTTGKKPFTFRLGVGEVIKGWDLGVEGMRVGDKRKVLIPPQLGYGTSGVKGAIPPNAVLEFEVTLVDVK